MSNHRASAKSDLIILVSLLLTSVSGCYHEADYDLTDVKIGKTLDLAIRSGLNQIPADGYSKVTLEASLLTGEADPTNQKIDFSATGGTLIGGAAISDGRAVRVDGTLKARIELVSSTTVGAVTVRASVDAVPAINREVTVSFVPVVVDSVIRFSTSNVVAPADGATLTPLRIDLADEIPLDQRAVSLEVTSGVFEPSNNSTITIPKSQASTIDLVLRSASLSQVGTLRATVAGFTTSVNVRFDPALPDTILVDASGSSLQSGSSHSLSLTARLIRSIGTVTPGTFVSFSTSDSAGTPVLIGSFRDVGVSDNFGHVTATYSAGNSSYRGRLFLVGRVVSVAKVISGEIEVEITD